HGLWNHDCGGGQTGDDIELEPVAVVVADPLRYGNTEAIAVVVHHRGRSRRGHHDRSPPAMLGTRAPLYRSSGRARYRPRPGARWAVSTQSKNIRFAIRAVVETLGVPVCT